MVEGVGFQIIQTSLFWKNNPLNQIEVLWVITMLNTQLQEPTSRNLVDQNL